MNHQHADALTREDIKPGHFFRRLTRAYGYLIISIDPGPWRHAGIWYDEYIGTPFPGPPGAHTRWKRTMSYHSSARGFMSRRLLRVPFPDPSQIIKDEAAA